MEDPFSIHSASIGSRWKVGGIQVICTLVLLFTLAIGNAWGANGDTLFVQHFDTATTVAYDATGTAVTYDNSTAAKTLSGLTGAGTNHFQYIGWNNKNNCGLAINSNESSNAPAVDCTKKLGAYANNSSFTWALYHTKNFATTAPTAVKFEMDILLKDGLATGKHEIAVVLGSGFDGSNSAPASNKGYTGFAIKSGSSAGNNHEICKVGSTTGLSASASIANNTNTHITWYVNNTGESLTYKTPSGNDSTLATGKYALFIGKKCALAAQACSSTASSAFSGTTIQNLYIGNAVSGKHRVVIDNVSVVDLTPAPACETPSITTQPTGASLAIGDANPTLSVVASNTTSYAWKESSNGTSYDGSSTLATTASFTPEVNDAAQTKYYYCELVNSCNTSNVVKTNIVTVNVAASITYYTVTLVPAGGTISDATGWTADGDNYTKTVAEGTELTLPTFTKENRTFKTWRKAGPADVASPVTVDGDLSLTAIWTATIEQVIYSWEGAEGGAIETGGTATGSVDGLINIAKSGYYCLQINGNTSYDKYVEITLSGEEKVKTGDKIRYTGFYTNTGTKNAAVKMRVSGGTAIFTGANLPRIEETSPRTDTYTVLEGINAAAIQITRHQTQTNSYLTKLQIIREVLVEEANIRTVTFNYNDGGATSNTTVEVASGSKVYAPATPAYAHHRFHEWQLSGSTYNFSSPVTSNITLVANWTQLYTITYVAGDASATGDAPTQVDKAATETFTVAANTFAVEGKDFVKWNDGTKDYNPDDTYTVGTANVVLTAQWEAQASNDATLKALSVAGLTLAPAFAAETENYTVTKAYGADDPAVGDVTATPAADGADVDVAWNGTNKKFTITVTALDNTTEKTYTITVNEAEAPKSLSRVLFSNGFDAFIDNANHTVKAYYLAGQAAPTATTITAGAGTAGELSEGKIRVTGADDSYVDYIVTLEAVTPNTTSVAEAAPAGEFAGDEAWVKNGLLVYGNAAGYSAGDKWYVNRRLTKGTDPEDDQRVIAGWVRSYFFVGNASKFIMTVGGNRKLDYTIDGGTPVENVNTETLEIALTKGNHMIEIVSHQSDGDCRLSAPKLVELPPSHTVNYWPGEGTGATIIDDDAIVVADCPGTFTAPTGKIFNGWKDGENNDVEVGAPVTADMALTAQWINHYAVTFNMNGHGDAIDPQDIKHGAKATRPDDPSESGWDFGGWFTDNGTFEAPFDFNTAINAATPLYAKWTADPCPAPESLSKVVLTSASDGTVTGNNSNEYAGEKVIGGLGESQAADVDPSHEGVETGYKLSSGGSAIVFATLKKGTFQVGDRVVVTITKAQDAYKVEEVAQPILDIYYGTDKNDATFLTTIENVTAAGSYTYRLTAADVTAIGTKKGIGVFRPNSGRTQNPYVYSVEIKGCREWATFHTLTFKNIDGTATIAAEPLEEGAYASTVAPVAPKIAMKRFLGWAEAIDGTPVNLTSYTITEDKILYAVYEDIVCPTTGTVYKFQLKTDLTSGNIFTSAPGELTLNTTDHLSSMVNGEVTVNLASGKNTNRVQFYDDKAIGFANGDGASITLTLDCALATGDEIRFINYAGNGNKMNLSDGAHSLELNGNNAETVQKITVNSDWNGADELTLTRGGNTPKLTYFEIYRPAKYDVSFNMMGHGSAIADLEDVVEGSKIAAPSPAPTDADYSFAGWYKENTLENEWDFDVDVVETNTTLYAKWLDKSDATLKSLKYGETDIVLVVDQYTYDITLPSLTSSVPALTAETNNPNATKAIVNDTFDGEGNATSTVTVTPEVGADKVYTVNFARGIALEQVTVTTSMEWDWSAAGVTAEINNTNTPGLSGNDVVIANVPGVNNDADFNSQALKASGTNAIRTTYFQGKELNIKTDKEGVLIVDFSGTNTKARVLKVYDNADTEIAAWSYNSEERQVQQVIVPAGKVTLKAFEGESGNNARIYNLKFYAYDTERADSWIAPNELGTICYPNGHVVVGADVYQMAGVDSNNKFVFDEVTVTEPGKPYLFVAKSYDPIKFYKTTAAAAAVAGTSNGMVGTFSNLDLLTSDPKATKWYYFADTKFYSVAKYTGSTVSIPANRAYVDLNEPHPASAPKFGVRRISFDVQGTNAATGFENTEATEAPRKVMINGTLFILRGEKMYDATGRLVK